MEVNMRQCLEELYIDDIEDVQLLANRIIGALQRIENSKILLRLVVFISVEEFEYEISPPN